MKDEIPDDIMQAAQAAIIETKWQMIPTEDFDHAVLVVARAIFTECLKTLELLKNPTAVRINYLRGDIACQDIIDEAVATERQRCLDAQPSTAENPNEDAYQRGRFDGVMEYGRAIATIKAKEQS